MMNTKHLLSGHEKARLFIVLLAVAIGLVGCNNDDDHASGSEKDISGILLAPESTSEAGARLNEVSARRGPLTKQVAHRDDCPGDVPAGYVRLSGVVIELFDEDGNKLSETLTTDGCGMFEGAVPEKAVLARAEPDGLRPVEIEIQAFAGSEEPTVVSTIKSSAEYQIRSLFRQSDGRFGFVVTDDVSGRPVIGIPASKFSLATGDNDIPLESVTVAAQTREAATVVLAIDVSGSMETGVYQDGNGDNYTRYHLARDGAHLFLDEKGDDDETAIIYFDGTVRPVNDEYLASNFTFEDSSGSEVNYTFSESGFTSKAEDLRLVVDALSPYNLIYQNPYDGYGGIQRPPHSDTPALTISSDHLWPSATAVWDAVSYSLDAVSERSLVRKAVVTLGDGEDNASSTALQEAIDKANNLGIPVYTIALGLGNSQAEENLQRLGEETGGGLVSVDDEGAEVELLKVFESIQTGIVFQYIATLKNSGDVQSGNTVTLKLEYNGLLTERNFTVQ
ncbi:vWA domain-containing protein [Sinomicrobium weinanense]|uniref:VWA domain-containing protein n=1 Tax=Sinomicrobium weinanense TaxID=2842200 RepID=A0A926JN87_9FLAO|nr:VWA domain-containing protein [Sinomicrobium weinanense]MBC9794344.1 VWA domain-containing protein [Sinomicrobium weinanense]MBU3124251.1 VWA domain-containing protein [Sinomicrobium weinanense]